MSHGDVLSADVLYRIARAAGLVVTGHTGRSDRVLQIRVLSRFEQSVHDATFEFDPATGEVERSRRSQLLPAGPEGPAATGLLGVQLLPD